MTAELMTATYTSPEDALEYHISSLLHGEHRTWSNLIKSAAAGEMLIPRTRVPHMHPENPKLPCMFCAAHSRDINAVSAAVLLSLAETEWRDDAWNAEDGRRSEQVVKTSKGLDVDAEALGKMFGPNWAAVVALAYRIEFADSAELADLTRMSMSVPRAATMSRTGGRDWTHSSKWLVGVGMNGRNNGTQMSDRLRQREAVTRLHALASFVALHGVPASDDISRWIVVPTGHEPVRRQPPELRIVR